MEDTESVISYDSIKNDPKSLLSLRGKYVRLKLIQNRTANGFVHVIDPEGYSMILLQGTGETYDTILIPGQAILGISVIDSIPSMTLIKNITSPAVNLAEKKTKLMSWFKKNLLPVTEANDNIVFKSVLILPPYDMMSIYSTNLIVTKQVREIMEKMPEDFIES